MIESQAQENQTGIADRISNAREAAMSENSKPNRTQEVLEKIYGKSTPEIIEDYAAYNDKWHKYIDIGK